MLIKKRIINFIDNFVHLKYKENKKSNTINYSNSISSGEEAVNNIVDEIILSIQDIIGNNDIGYNIFEELSKNLKNIDNNKYAELIKVFEAALTKFDDEWTKFHALNDRAYYEEHWPDIALSTIMDILKYKEDGSTNIEWLMQGVLGPKTKKLEVYHLDSVTWEILKLYIEDSKGNEEGYEYKCILEPKISELRYPFCNCPGEIASTDTVRGNYINSNCDTYGTCYGIKAQGLYAFYITDLDKFAIVYESYWEC